NPCLRIGDVGCCASCFLSVSQLVKSKPYGLSTGLCLYYFLFFRRSFICFVHLSTNCHSPLNCIFVSSSYNSNLVSPLFLFVGVKLSSTRSIKPRLPMSFFTFRVFLTT